MSETINIIGAGPAGLTAAIVLAKHGLKARVYEMSSDVGHRLNGDFQWLENWSSEKDIKEILGNIGIAGSDYDMLWKRELIPMLETSLINRYLFERFGHLGYRYLTKKFAKVNPCDFLRKHYNYSFFKHLLLPIAKKKYESRVKDTNCNHENCSCVWCRCGERTCP